MAHPISRRGLLGAAAAVGTGALTGCAMGGDDDTDDARGDANSANPLGV
jgi:hypothetical protein